MVGKRCFGRYECFKIVILAGRRSCTRPVRITRLQFAGGGAFVSAIVGKDILEFGTEPLLDRTAARLQLCTNPVSRGGTTVVAFGCLIRCFSARRSVFFSSPLEQRVALEF